MLPTENSYQCPEWSEDIPKSQVRKFRIRLEVLYSSALNEIGKKYPDDLTLRHWHRDLFDGFVPIPYYAGNYRHDNRSRFPCLGIDVGVGGLPGCPYQNVPRAMTDLMRKASEDLKNLELYWQTMPKRQRFLRYCATLAIIIGSFIRIHPFMNGNGRISRFLWNVLLARFGYSPQVSIAPRPGLPYGDIMKDAMEGDYAPLMNAILSRLISAPKPL